MNGLNSKRCQIRGILISKFKISLIATFLLFNHYQMQASLALTFLPEGQQTTLQEKDIKGVVTTADDGSPLPGVNITLKGTTIGTQTDIDGTYQIKASTGDILVFSFLGMETIEEQVGELEIMEDFHSIRGVLYLHFQQR